MINVRDICFGYGDAKSSSLVLSSLSFKLKKGDHLAVVGPSGSGKTTILKLIAGEIIAQSGELVIDEIPYLSPEQPALLNHRSVLENALLVRELSQDLTKTDVSDARALLKKVGLDNSELLRPHELSAGMRRRVAICQSLLSGWSLLLLDEPLSHLDQSSVKLAEQTIHDFSDANDLTLVTVTHDLSAAVASSDILLIISGAPAHRSELLTMDTWFSDRSPESRRSKPDFAEAVASVQARVVELCQ